MLSYVLPQPSLNLGDEPAEFRIGSLGDQFHTPVGQISDKACHGKASGDVIGRSAKADALDTAGEVDGPALVCVCHAAKYSDCQRNF